MAAKLTGWGLWAVAPAGALTSVPWIVIFFVANPNVNTDQAGFARSATDAPHAIVGYLYMIGLFCLLFGVLAISAWLQDTQIRSDPVSPSRAGGIVGRAWNGSVSSYAMVGMVFGIVAIAMLIGLWTILVFATATVGDVYLSGHPGAGEVFKVLSGGHWSARMVPLFIVWGLAALVAAYCLGSAVRRSGKVSKWVGPAFGFGFALTMASSPVVSLVGGVLLVVAGVMIARAGAETARRAAA